MAANPTAKAVICDFCDDLGEECESRGVWQKCSACAEAARHEYESSDEALLRRCDNPWVEEL